MVIKPQFTWVGYFSEGLAVAKIGGALYRPYGVVMTKKGEYLGKYIFIGKSGKTVIDPKADEIYSFSEGLARIKIKNKYGFIGENGKVIIRPQYTDAEDFSEGLSQVDIDGEPYFINKEGKIVFKSLFGYVKDFKSGLAWIQEGDYSDNTAKYGYIDKTGRVIWKPTN